MFYKKTPNIVVFFVMHQTNIFHSAGLKNLSGFRKYLHSVLAFSETVRCVVSCDSNVTVIHERYKLGLTCHMRAGASPSGLNRIKLQLYLDAEATTETDPGLIH